jgi:phasin
LHNFIFIAAGIVLADNLRKNPTNAQGNAPDWTHCPKRRSSMTAQARTATDAPHVLRDVAETSAAQAKETFDKLSAAAGEATNLLKNSYATSFKGTQNYSAKVLEFTNANISAAVEQATKLASVKSPMEFFALSNEYAKRQFEILTRQAQELGTIVQKMTVATNKDR